MSLSLEVGKINKSFYDKNTIIVFHTRLFSIWLARVLRQNFPLITFLKKVNSQPLHRILSTSIFIDPPCIVWQLPSLMWFFTIHPDMWPLNVETPYDPYSWSAMKPYYTTYDLNLFSFNFFVFRTSRIIATYSKTQKIYQTNLFL